MAYRIDVNGYPVHCDEPAEVVGLLAMLPDRSIRIELAIRSERPNPSPIIPAHTAPVDVPGQPVQPDQPTDEALDEFILAGLDALGRAVTPAELGTFFDGLYPVARLHARLDALVDLGAVDEPDPGVYAKAAEREPDKSLVAELDGDDAVVSDALGKRILGILRKRGPLAPSSIVDALPQGPGSWTEGRIHARLGELRAAGLLKHNGQRARGSRWALPEQEWL